MIRSLLFCGFLSTYLSVSIGLEQEHRYLFFELGVLNCLCGSQLYSNTSTPSPVHILCELFEKRSHERDHAHLSHPLPQLGLDSGIRGSQEFLKSPGLAETQLAAGA